MIVSPNKVFSDYISNVLPELGEETVPETSMEQILSGVLEHKYKYQTYFGLVNELLEKPSSSLIDRIAYKASFGFISELDKFILHIENTYFKAADVKLTKYITIPAPFIEEQYLRFNRYPIRRRFDAMADYMLDMLKIQYTFTVTTADRNLLKKKSDECLQAITTFKSTKISLNGQIIPECSKCERDMHSNTQTWHRWHTYTWHWRETETSHAESNIC